MSKDTFRFRVSDDPVRDVGSRFHIKPTRFNGSDALDVPNFVTNWGATQGSVLAIVFSFEDKHEVLGTAFLVAPGLAISASHIFSSHLEQAARGEVSVSAVGIRDKSADFWRVRKITHSNKADTCLLSISAASNLPEDQTYYQFPVTTRQPNLGESIHLLGFRSGTYNDLQRDLLEMDLIASQGRVTSVWNKGRDKTLVPFPAIEINAGSLGGMSGGIAIAADGHVLGIISRGLDSEDGKGPTYISWIINCLTQTIDLVWPIGFYGEALSMLEINERVCFIEGRNAFFKNDDNTWTYRPWVRNV